MKLKNVVILVKDIEKAKQFYKDVFSLQVILDSGTNVVFIEGLVLQELKPFEDETKKNTIFYNNASLLYFETFDIEDDIKRLDKYKISYVSKYENEYFKLIRVYDLDGNLLEIRQIK